MLMRMRASHIGTEKLFDVKKNKYNSVLKPFVQKTLGKVEPAVNQLTYKVANN